MAAATTSGLSNILDILSKTSSLFGGKSSTTKTSSTISQDQLNAMIADQLSQTGGLADVTSGAHVAGLYNDTVKSQLASQLSANVAAKVAEANRTTTSTTTQAPGISGGAVAKILGAAQIGSKLLSTTPGKIVGKKLDDVLGTNIFGDSAPAGGISNSFSNGVGAAAGINTNNILGENAGGLSALLNPTGNGDSASSSGSDSISGTGALATAAFTPRVTPTVSVSVPGEDVLDTAAGTVTADSTAASSGVSASDVAPYIGTALSAARATQTDGWGSTVGTGVGTFLGGIAGSPAVGAIVGSAVGSAYQPEFSDIYGPSSMSRKSLDSLSEDAGNLDLGGLVTDGGSFGLSGIQASTGASFDDQLEGITDPSSLLADAGSRISDVGGGIIDGIGGIADTIHNAFSGGCFITTAVCEWKGMADDCEMLQKLRAFRDGYMHAEHPELITQYYKEAPVIVEAIKAKSAKVQVLIWEEVFDKLEVSVAAIEQGDLMYAMLTYKNLFYWLKTEAGVN